MCSLGTPSAPSNHGSCSSMFMTYFINSFGNLIEEEIFFLEELIKVMFVIEADKFLHLSGSARFLIHVTPVRGSPDQ